MKSQEIKKHNIPNKSGVYMFKKGRRILYIGKATSLKDRIKSYFAKDLIEARGPIIVDMVFKAAEIKWITSDSVLEALILESNLIKKLEPFYNTKEKSDKSFNYVCITKDKWPKIVVKRKKDIKRGQVRFSSKTVPDPVCYGPYPSGASLREALKIIRKIFPFLDEKSKIKGRYEFYKQIGLVPEIGDRRKYLKNIKNIKLFFAGKKNKILKNLEKEMKRLIRTQMFEEAAKIRNQIFALRHIQDVSLIKEEKIITPLRIEAYDIAHLSGRDMVGAMVVVENGELVKNEYKRFKIKGFEGINDIKALKEILERRLKHKEWKTPDLVVIDGGKAQLNAANRALGDIKAVSVVKDERHRPKDILGDRVLISRFEGDILLANSEAHRFAQSYHRQLSNRVLPANVPY